MADPTPIAADHERDRLREFWNRRYRTFELAESGWAGAGQRFNQYVYRCKEHAARAALHKAGFTSDQTFDVLDAGCGQGYFCDFYAREFPRARYTGVDVSSRVIAHLGHSRPGGAFFEGDLATWQPAKTFDVIQAFEVLHLVLDDAVVAKIFSNLASLLRATGVLLVTMTRSPVEEATRPYTRHRPLDRMRGWWEAAGLRERLIQPIYYWLPDSGPEWPLTRPVFYRLDPWLLYVADRLAVKLQLPRLPTGPDSRTELVALTRHTG